MRQIFAIVGRFVGIFGLFGVWVLYFDSAISAVSKYDASNNCLYTIRSGCHYYRTTPWWTLHPHHGTVAGQAFTYLLAVIVATLMLALTVGLAQLLVKIVKYGFTGEFDVPDFGPIDSSAIPIAFMGGMMGAMIGASLFNSN